VTGEQKFNIPLDSPLDINSNDMLVNVQSPKFSFNRQKYLGSILQNSIRYEADGHFAGWYGHTFKLNLIGNSTITPDIGNFTIFKQDNSYDIVLDDVNVAFTFVPTAVVQWTSGSGTIVRTAEDTVNITGTTNKGDTFNINVNVYTGAILSATIPNTRLVPTVSLSNNKLVLVISQSQSQNDYMILRPNKVLTINNIKVIYSRNATTSTWGPLFILTDNNVLSTPTGSEFDIVGTPVVRNNGTVNEYVEAQVRNNAIIDVAANIVAEAKRTAVAFMYPSGGLLKDVVFNAVFNIILKLSIGTVRTVSNIYLNNSVQEDVNNVITWTGQGDILSSARVYNNWRGYISRIPIWLRHAADITYNLTAVSSGDRASARLNLGISNEAHSFHGKVKGGATGASFQYNIRIKRTYMIQAVVRSGSSGSYTYTWGAKGNWQIAELNSLTTAGTTKAWNTSSTNGIVYDQIDSYPTQGTTTTEAEYNNTYGTIPGLPTATAGQHVTVKDTWVFEVRSINTSNNNIPLDTAAATVVDCPLSALYMLYTFSCTFNLRAEGIDLLDYTGNTRSLVQGSKEPFYVPLVKYTADDEALFDYINGIMHVIMPIAVHAYTRYRVEAVDIINDDNAAAFTITPIALPYLANNTPFIFDNTGQMPLNIGKLVFVDSLQVDGTSDNAQNELYIGIKYTNPKIPIYCTTISNYNDGGTNEGIWPLWIENESLDNNTYLQSSSAVMSLTNNKHIATLNVEYDFMTFLTAKNCTIATDTKGIYGKGLSQQPVFTTGAIIISNYTQICRMTLDANNYTEFVYDAKSGEVTTTTNSYTTYQVGSVDFSYNKVADRTMSVLYHLTCTDSTISTMLLYRTFITEKTGLMAAVNIVSQTDEFVNLTAGYGRVNTASAQLLDATVVESVGVDVTLNGQTYYVAIKSNAEVQFMPNGIIYRNDTDLKYVSSTTTSCIFTYKTTQYTLTLDSNSDTTLAYNIIDIRDGSTQQTYNRTLNNTTMFIKQFWSNTTETEQYWWIDSTHVLELTKQNMRLWQKDTGIDDWNGDNWVIIKSEPRSNYIGTDDLYYNVTNAYESTPRFFKLSVKNNAIVCNYYNVLTAVWGTASINVTKLSFGQAPARNAISSYNTLDAKGIISSAKISATVTKDVMLIGIALGRGLNQWTWQIGGNVITGYGYVGVDGSVTGGQIPIECCGTTGFNRVVNNIDGLKDLTEIPNACYGNESNVWFLFKQISGIISHFKFVNNSFRLIELKLNNNIDELYDSFSFYTSKMYDTGLKMKVVKEIFTYEGAEDEESGIIQLGQVDKLKDTALFYVNMLLPMLAFVSHCVGQYAYVWRNTEAYYKDKQDPMNILFEELAKSRQKDIENDKDVQTYPTFSEAHAIKNDIAFGKREYTQKVQNMISSKLEYHAAIVVGNIKNNADTFSPKGIDFSSIGGMMMTAPMGIMDWINDLANYGTNKKIYEYEAMSNALYRMFDSIGVSKVLTSILVAMYNLGMFYQISDKQQCFSGPGFVQHNFIGQCIAQSSTDVQVTGLQLGSFVTLRQLSVATVEMQIAALRNGATIVSTALDIAGDAMLIAGLASGQAWLVALGAVTKFFGWLFGNDRNQKAEDLSRERDFMLELCDALGSTIMNSSNRGNVNKKSLDIEGTHTYGDKPMTFMWPVPGVTSQCRYTNESVEAVEEFVTQELNYAGTIPRLDYAECTYVGDNKVNEQWMNTLEGDITLGVIKAKGSTWLETAPEDMAVVEGVTSFLPQVAFKEADTAVSDPVFGPPVLQDYIVDKQWDIYYTGINGAIHCVSCGDTKVVDGPPSNIVLKGNFAGIASSYTAIEIKNNFNIKYLRPYMITPKAIALNLNDMNCVYEGKAYHAFDGQGPRVVQVSGDTGIDKAYTVQHYLFQINDHFKRSSIFPPNQFRGAFTGWPMTAIQSKDRVYNVLQSLSEQKGLINDIPGENRNLQRYSIPVHTELISTLPAMIRTLGPYKLNVVEGDTSLTTILRTGQTLYKAPSSVDFNINGVPFRATEEFICSIQNSMGAVAVKDVCATLGFEFIGATTKEAFFYSPATRMYYSFNGADIQKRDVLNRFKDIKVGRWDFVSQEVMFQCLLGKDVIVCRIDNQVAGEVYIPPFTVWNEQCGFKILSAAGGNVFQGPKRFTVNRFILLDNMITGIESNMKKWERLSKSDYIPERDYGWVYEDINTVAPNNAVKGWTHNPFKLATAMLGISEDVDCKFEWELTFAWTEQMEQLFQQNEFVCVNLAAETVTQGGVKLSEVTHVYLFKECFNRDGNAGYYTFQFQSNNGIGNRERLYVWSDGLMALEELQLATKNITKRRTQPLTQQVDVRDLQEM
jgi:hypothetical protein